MTPADLPTYMREILCEEWNERVGPGMTADDELRGGFEAALAAMHRVYLDRDEGSSLHEANQRRLTQLVIKEVNGTATLAELSEIDVLYDVLSPAQRSSLPLPDRERTAGRDDFLQRSEIHPDITYVMYGCKCSLCQRFGGPENQVSRQYNKPQPEEPIMRNLEQQPYTADEKRVVDYLREANMTTFASAPNAGDDPIGFLMTAHVTAVHAVKGALDAMTFFNTARR